MPQGRKKPSQIDQIVAGASAQFLDEEADRQGVPRDFARKIAGIESSGRADVISGQRQSSAGAVGKMQLMPGTARDLGVDPNHLEQNVQGGVMYLRQQLDAFGGDQRKAAAAYNAGPGAVRKYGGVPPFPETQKYANQFPSGEESDIDRIVRSVGQTAQPEPEPSTLRIVPGRQQTTVRGPTRPSAPNPFALTGPTGFEQAGQQVAARTAQISPEVAAQADRRAARIEADRRRYGQKSVVGKRLEDVGEAFAGIGESAQRGFQNLTYPVRKGLSAVSPTIAARLKAGEEAQAHTAQRMGERAQAADSLASKTTRALTSGAVGATTMIPVAMAGGIPAVMAVTGLQQDWSDPKAAALNTALSGLPIAAGRAISPAASRVAGRAFTAPVAQEAARRGIEAGAGGVTNVGQYAGTQALLGRPIDPEEALAQGVAGGVLGTAMAPGRRQAAAMARPRSPIDIPVYDDAGEVAGYDRVDAPLTPDVVGQGVNRAGDLGATVQRAGDIRPRPRGTAPMPIQNRIEQQRPPILARQTQAMPIQAPEPVRPLAILQENANEAKINAAQFEQAGDWESAQREYDVAHKTLVEAQRQMKRVRNQTPEQADALSAIAREISGAALNRNRASRSATVARREQGIAGRQARKSQNAVENAPTADLPAETNPLLKSVVNPEGGIPESAPESPSGLFGQLGRQQAVEQAKPQRGPKDSRQLSAAEYLKRATNGEGVRVSDRGEARVLGAKEAGIVGLTNRASQFTTSDAQVMLDEGGFSLQDGRRFTDPSVTENDVLSFLAESGREGRMNTRDLDQRIEREAAEYYENQPTGEVRPASNRLPRIGDLPPSRMSRPLEPIPRGTESDRPLTVREQARKAGGVTGDLEVMDRLARRQGVERPRDYAERTSYGEPGSGASLSQYTDMMRGNRAAFDQLRGMNVDSVEAQEIVARIEDYNERHAVAPHHLENELNTIRGEQAGTARRADLGIGSAPLRDPSTAELRDFYSRPDETRAPSAPLRPVRREAIQVRQPEPAAETPRVVVPERASGNVADTIAEDLRRLHAMNPQEIEQSLQAAETRRNDDIRNPQMNEVERRMNRDLLKFANERRHEMVRAKQLPAKSPRGPARGERPTAKEATSIKNPLEQDVTILSDEDLAKRIRDAERILNAPELSQDRRRKVDGFLNRAKQEQGKRTPDASPETPRTVSHPDPAIDGQLVLATTADGRVIVANGGNKSGVSVVKDSLTTEPKPDRVQQSRTVRVGDDSIDLTPEQSARWEKEVDEPLRLAKERYDYDIALARKAPDRVYAARLKDQAEKDHKAAGMQIASIKRQIAGKMTPKESAEAARREASNYSGKDISVRGVNGKVAGTAFGKVKVKLEDGKMVTVDRDQIAPPVKYTIPDEAMPELNPNRERGAKTRTDVENSPEFKKWFGDSKVVDDEGKPLVVYHGTGAAFDAFSKEKAGGVGFYFTRDAAAASNYAAQGDGSPNIRPVYLSITNPATSEAYSRADKRSRGGNPRAQIVEALKAEGFDGIIRKGEIIAFSPEQIKSATGNRGTFDPNDANITRQRGNQPPPMPDRVTARDLADNVRAEYRPAANRPGTVYLNDWGLEALNAADYLEFRAGREGAADDRITGGVNYPPEEARQIADHIRERAGRPNFSENGRKNLETMARQIELAADDGNVSFVPMQGQAMRQARQTIRHEAFHSQQSAIHPDVHELTTPRWLRAQKFGAVISAELGQRGYSERQHPAEAAAFVASGNWDAFGMSRDDARQFLTDYFDDVAYRHGKEAISKFRAIHPALQEVVEARRGTNEPRFGSSGLGRSIGSAVSRQRGVERPGRLASGGGGSLRSREAGPVPRRPTDATVRSLRAITSESLRAGQSVESAPAQSLRRQGLAGIRAEDLRAESGAGGNGVRPPRAGRRPSEPEEPNAADGPKDTDKPAGFWSKLSDVRKAGLLSGPKTHIVNMLGNTAYQVTEEVSRIPAGIMDMALSAATGRRSVAGANPMAMLRASGKAATDGVREAIQIMKTGLPAETARRLQVEDSKFTNPVLKAYTQFVFRALGAEDQIFKTYAMTRSLESQAKAMAINDRRAGKIGRGDVKARMEAYRDNPTNEMSVNAIADAEVATFQNDNKLSSAVRAGRGQIGEFGNFAVDLFLPFDRTPTNIIARTLEMTPLGFGRNAKQLAEAIGTKSFDEKQQRAFAQTFGRASTGSALIYLGYALAAQGVMTGLADPDPRKRAKQEAIAPPASIKIGGRWYQVGKFAPAGALMGLGATIHRDSKAGKGKGDMAISAATGMARIGLELPHLRAAKEVSDLSRTQTIPGKAGRLAGSFIPTIVDNVGTLTDPYQRDTKTFMGGLGSRVPGARRLLPVRKDSRGRAIKTEKSDVIDPFNSRPARP